MEVANTKFKQAVGLMFRDFGKSGGMVFPYSKASKPGFYNKNVKFPLRIYFVTKDMEIKSTFVMQKNSFKNYFPSSPINYVVEVPLKGDLSNDPGENPKIVLK